jgi:nucleotide-binding universal stress UspA family protein
MAKILLPIDLSDPHSWDQALPVALDQARTMGAELHVATVVPDFGLAAISTYMEEGFEQKILKEAGADLAEWVAKTVPEGTDCHPHVLHGTIYDEILRAADRLGADLIVMGSHRPTLKDYLLGPNTARVVRHAKQSVYVVRDKAGA